MGKGWNNKTTSQELMTSKYDDIGDDINCARCSDYESTESENEKEIERFWRIIVEMKRESKAEKRDNKKDKYRFRRMG